MAATYDCDGCGQATPMAYVRTVSSSHGDTTQCLTCLGDDRDMYEGKRMKIKVKTLRKLIKEEFQIVKLLIVEAPGEVWPDAVAGDSDPTDLQHLIQPGSSFGPDDELDVSGGVADEEMLPRYGGSGHDYGDDELSWQTVYDLEDDGFDDQDLAADTDAMHRTIDDERAGYAGSPGVSTGTQDEIEPVLEYPNPGK